VPAYGPGLLLQIRAQTLRPMRARGILCLRLAPPVARTFQGRCTGVLAARALVDISQLSVDNVSQPPSTGHRLDLGVMSVPLCVS
jgi:hypothetical protein